MPRPCGWCTHPKRADLERRVFDGESIRSVSQDSGHSESAANRHLRNHVHPELRIELRASNRLHLTDFADRYVELVEESARARDHARTHGDGRLLLQAVQQERETLSVLMNRLGIDDGETVSQLREAKALSCALHKVLSATHPDVSLALAADLESRDEDDLASAFRDLAGMASTRQIADQERTS